MLSLYIYIECSQIPIQEPRRRRATFGWFGRSTFGLGIQGSSLIGSWCSRTRARRRPWTAPHSYLIYPSSRSVGDERHPLPACPACTPTSFVPAVLAFSNRKQLLPAKCSQFPPTLYIHHHKLQSATSSIKGYVFSTCSWCGSV